ncbi:MAG TPA: hypothetical protein VIL90_00595, partial [Puia sp.]
KLIPYIMVGRDESLYTTIRERWRGGDHAFLIRGSQVIEKSKGFEKPRSADASHYKGSAQKIFMRYTYNYKQLLEYGFTGEKDAGEPFLKGAQRYGFDFYSFHFFLQRAGLLRALAIGDFAVNLGQGLLQWQTVSFTKSSQALALKREASTFKPYHSAGEFNFHRGIGVSLENGKWQASLFVSSQKISTNLVSDTNRKEDLLSSFQNSGYHRTASEIADRNNSRQFSAGGNIRFRSKQFMVGFNYIQFHFSRPFQKRDEPYNLYSFHGKELTDYSIDFNYTLANVHTFGEIATDQWLHTAFVQGALISLGENLDMSFLYRNISPAFQSLYSDAFTENSIPNNEKGFYAGFAFRPATGWQADLYYDVYVFPWLKYRIDGPSAGRDILFQVVYQPNKWWHFTTLYKNESKDGNLLFKEGTTNTLATSDKQRWLIETQCSASRSVSFTSLMEFLWLTGSGKSLRQGFLGTATAGFRKSGFSVNVSLAVFETEDYETRIYANEPDMLYNISLPAYYGRGIHYYMNLHKDFKRLPGLHSKQFKLSGWLKWGQIFYPGLSSIGSGLDEIKGNKKSEIKAQVLVQW